MTWFAAVRARLDAFALDLKLGGRMLVKYPGLTVIGGLAMAFAISVGTVIFEVITLLVYPTLPLPAGDRIVEVRNWDVAANRSEPRALHDFLAWRGTLRSVQELGAWRDVTSNLIVDGDSRAVFGAEMTAAGFRVADGAPLIGRVLVDDDERAGAPPVAVLGYEVWRTRFGSDPGVLGRTVQLGTAHVTIVGVMREGFAFPVAHELWTPLRTGIAGQAPRSGPAITMFGLLAPGATLDAATAELAALGQRAAIDKRPTHEHLQPQVRPFTTLFATTSVGDLGILASIQFFAVMLLVLVCGNIALLLFARAATRESELAVRSALGASRRRLVGQIFIEALVLGGVAAVAGLVAADILLRSWGAVFLENNFGRLPFWIDPRLSPATVAFALALTVFGSAIAGVVPALKVTRRMGDRLKQATAGAGGLQFGGIWTVVIVAQVAVTVAFPAIIFAEQWQLRHAQTFPAGFAAEEYLAVRIVPTAPVTAPGADGDAAIAAHRAALAPRLEELRRLVNAEPSVAGVTFVDRLPRAFHVDLDIELYDPARGRAEARRPAGGAGNALREVHVAGIDPSYFEVLQAPVLAGRGFHSGDLAPGARAVVVDQGFVDQVLEGRHALGQRFRVRREGGADDPWLEVVGVVKELGMGTPVRRGRAAGVYFPARPEQLQPLQMIVHVRGDPLALVPRLRDIATGVDPALRLLDVQRVDEVTKEILWTVTLWLRATTVMAVIALVLSLSGIYAVLSFTVARRTREIGVRLALGASRPRIVTAIFRRPLTQVVAGIVAGLGLIAGGIVMLSSSEFPGADRLADGLTLSHVAWLLVYANVMLAICLLACVVPTRRALAVEPTVALRTE